MAIKWVTQDRTLRGTTWGLMDVGTKSPTGGKVWSPGGKAWSNANPSDMKMPFSRGTVGVR